MSKHYDSDYFHWQRTIGEFGGVANSFKFKKSIRRGDTVVDFGCGGGFLLKNLDCAVRLGIEVNKSAHRQIIENGVLPFSSASQIIDQRGTESVDVIISNHALEHTLDPLGEIKSLLPLLKTGGKIHFVVPCDKASLKWKSGDRNFHLYSWSPMNLGNLITEAGFEVMATNHLVHKWPPRYREIQRIVGWRAFNVLCRLWGHLERSWSQVEVIATPKMCS